jgi:hypothetical protein
LIIDPSLDLRSTFPDPGFSEPVWVSSAAQERQF